MAALLALKKPAGAATCENEVKSEDIEDRITKVTSSFQSKLQDWDVDSYMLQGNPAVMKLWEGEGFTFSFFECSFFTSLKAKELPGFKSEEVSHKRSLSLLNSVKGWLEK